MVTINTQLEISLELPVGYKVILTDKLRGSCPVPEQEKPIQKMKSYAYSDIGHCGFDTEGNFHHIKKQLFYSHY